MSFLKTGNVELSGKIQGIDLDKEVVTLSGNQIIYGRLHFSKGLKVDHLLVGGLIDNVNIEELCQNTVRKNGNQVIFGSMIVSGNIIFRSPLIVGHFVNGINIEEFNRSVVKFDEPASIKGIKTFKTLIVDGPVSVGKTIAGIDMNELSNRYMSLTRDQEIKSKIIFTHDVNIEDNLFVGGNLNTHNGIINGVNLIGLKCFGSYSKKC